MKKLNGKTIVVLIIISASLFLIIASRWVAVDACNHAPVSTPMYPVKQGICK